MTSPEINDLIITIGSQLLIVGSGLIAAYFKLRSEVQSKIAEVKNHTDVTLQKLNGMLSYVIHSFDRPAWIKIATQRQDGQIEFRMLELNELYSETFGISRNDYIGKTDLEAGWDKRTADQMRSHDLSVWASGESATITEVINGKRLRFRKIRVQSANSALKGIMCYSVDSMEPENCPHHQKNLLVDKCTVTA
jgi:hypothetical protein